ncbi:MAG: YgfZ/GcvT domain-containing protein [Acidimicrobiales bacterium]
MGERLDLEAGYRAVREAVGTAVVEREVVRAAGADVASYLQGQTSQDLAALAPGASAWALVLQPQGKLDAFVRAQRTGEDEFLLVTDAGLGEALVARLNRFKLRTRVEVELLAWACTVVLGPKAPEAVRRCEPGCVSVSFEWGGLGGYELLGPEPVLPHGVPLVSREVYEAVRVEAGLPRHGAELDERTLPAEAGLVGPSVSFTKGCYTGQELVARIDSRGSNVARRLRGLLLSGSAAPGDDLLCGARTLGKLTSVALSPRLGWVALGYVSRRTEIGQALVVRGPGDVGTSNVTAVVEELPLRPVAPLPGANV